MNTPFYKNHSAIRRFFPLFVVLFIVIGIYRITSISGVYSETVDEPPHIACGMEWLEKGVYNYEVLHPPLARISTAILPYLDGNHGYGEPNMVREGTAILHTNNEYVHNLTLSRLGVLPFFIIATLSLWFWTKRLYGDVPALLAVFIFTTLPPILAHAGFATTDMANTAAFFTLCWAYTLWLENPSVKCSVLLGLAAGFAFTSKFSAVVFLPFFALGYAIVVRLQQHGRIDWRNIRYRRRIGRFCITLAVAFIAVWGVYRFSFGPLLHGVHLDQLRYEVETRLGPDDPTGEKLISLGQIPVPMPEFWDGILTAFWKNKVGHATFLLGHKLHKKSDIRFFPVALSVKTPLASLLLFLAGCGFIILAVKKNRHWKLVLPVFSITIIMLLCLMSNINIGVRHILPVYPFLAMIAGYGLWRIFTVQKYYGPALAVVLIFWQVSIGVAAHPDYLPYFNELAGSHPENILVDSDLDWGQDMLRLQTYIREHNIDSISIALFTNADHTKQPWPVYENLRRYQRPQYRWLAASTFKIKVENGYEWIAPFKPVAKIGKTIWLYYREDGNWPPVIPPPSFQLRDTTNFDPN